MTLRTVLAFLVLSVGGLEGKRSASVPDEDILAEIPKEDVVGPFVRAIDGLLSFANGGRSIVESDDCQTRLIKIGDMEVKISIRPRGFCSYCCPFHHPSRYLRLFFFNKSTGNSPITIEMLKKKGNLKSAGVRNDVTSVFFIHGFTEHGMGNAPLYIRDAYLSREEDFNIFLVDWGEFTSLPWYPQAVTHSKLVAMILRRFIDFYHSTGELPISNIHMIGFSLGAHVAGFIGKDLKGGRLPRITGLDPALPMYPVDDLSNRLTREDAEFVDIVHTDAGIFGYPVSIGDVDFYPNGGNFLQPGCEVSSLAEKMFIEEFLNCGHILSWRLYGESVRNPRAFPATRINMTKLRPNDQFKFVTEAYLGFAANKSVKKGNYYLITNPDQPYGMTAGEQETEINTINSF